MGRTWWIVPTLLAKMNEMSSPEVQIFFHHLLHWSSNEEGAAHANCERDLFSWGERASPMDTHIVPDGFNTSRWFLEPALHRMQRHARGLRFDASTVQRSSAEKALAVKIARKDMKGNASCACNAFCGKLHYFGQIITRIRVKTRVNQLVACTCTYSCSERNKRILQILRRSSLAQF